MSVLSKSTLFDPKVTADLFSKVKGKSALANLSEQIPVSFVGNKIFTFAMDKEIDIVAENGEKSEGGVTVQNVKIVPIKFEYGARVSDEFMYASEEEQLNVLMAFNEGFAKKIARGLDIAAFHGVNPRTGAASDVIGANNFDSAVTDKVTYSSTAPDANVEAAISMLDAQEVDATGIAMAPAFRSALATLTANGAKMYPELAWGSNPGSVNGLKVEVNTTVAANSNKDRAIIGDFVNCFRWGYAKEIPLEVIPYGDPDNTNVDLKGSNQVYLRAEVYLGWAILDNKAFVRIEEATV